MANRTRRQVVLSLAALALGLGCASADEPPRPGDPEPLRDEAGFVELEPVTYAITGELGRAEMTSGAARLFYAFQPADSEPETKPLAILFNGGPGAATGILFGFNTSKRSFDPAWNGGAVVGESPSSFSKFANLLYVDARATGFSYGLVAGASDPAAREAELSVRNFNPFIDAADFARVLLRFLARRPALRGAPVVVIGESYGGIRASILLDMLLRPERCADGSGGFEDAALAKEIGDHLAQIASARGVSPAEAARAQFGRQALIQPRLSTEHQDNAAGELLDAPSSPLFELGEEAGVVFAPCDKKPSPCVPYANARAFLDMIGRDIYNGQRQEGYTFARFAEIAPRFTALEPLSTALGFDPTSITELFADQRGDAFRTIAAEPAVEELAQTFGALNPWDRYHLLEAYELVYESFAGPDALSLGIARSSPRWGELFLSNVLSVRTFITNAPHDYVIHTPALPGALAAYDHIVDDAWVEEPPASPSERPGSLKIRFTGGEERTVRFPRYATSGHVVTMDQPLEIAEDLRAWLADE